MEAMLRGVATWVGGAAWKSKGRWGGETNVGEAMGVLVKETLEREVMRLFRGVGAGGICGKMDDCVDNARLCTDAEGDCGKERETGESRGGMYGRVDAMVGRRGGVGNCSLDIIVPRVVGRRASSSSSSSDSRSEYGS
jgi:hypothetical protein